MVMIFSIFIIVILVFLAFDLGVFHRNSKEVLIQDALFWTGLWIIAALIFNILIYFIYEYQWLGIESVPEVQKLGSRAALQFFLGYLLEKSLSLDNIFIIALIFSYFKVPLRFQHRVLFYGILGALLLRGIMIWLGSFLVQRFDWVFYLFGLLLLWTAVKMLIERHDNLNPDKNWLIRWLRHRFKVTDEFNGDRFFVRVDGQLRATPLLLALAMVESSDVLFALDSIPAIFSVTSDPFLVFTSNIFAILGLRSLYFALAVILEKFRYMKMSLTFVLAYIGVKMILHHHLPIPNLISLAVVIGILSVGVAASILGANRDTARLISPVVDDLQRLLGWSYDGLRRLFTILMGITILLTGIVMIVLPGPAIIVIPIGLAILATEFAWAKWLLKKFQERSKALADRITGFAK